MPLYNKRNSAATFHVILCFVLLDCVLIVVVGFLVFTVSVHLVVMHNASSLTHNGVLAEPRSYRRNSRPFSARTLPNNSFSPTILINVGLDVCACFWFAFMLCGVLGLFGFIRLTCYTLFTLSSLLSTDLCKCIAQQW